MVNNTTSPTPGPANAQAEFQRLAALEAGRAAQGAVLVGDDPAARSAVADDPATLTRDTLLREAPDLAAAFDLYAGEDGELSLAEFERLSAAIAQAPQAADEADRAILEGLYQTHLGRPADGQGLAVWGAEMRSLRAQGKGDAEIRALMEPKITASFEYQAKHPDQTVEAHFEAFVGRPPSQAELADWSGRITQARAEGANDGDAVMVAARGISGLPEARSRAAAQAPAATQAPGTAAAPATAQPGSAAAPGQAPFISQVEPAGADTHYKNGWSNCGPTSVAMIVRAYGGGQGLTDAQLIMDLGHLGGTTADGTGVAAIATMAEAKGLTAETRYGADSDWISRQLDQGKMVVANGDYYAMAPHVNGAKTSGHYLTVTGKDADGNFLVNDPGDYPNGAPKVVTPAALQTFLASREGGGNATAIGPA